MTAPDLAAGRDVLAWTYNAVLEERERQETDPVQRRGAGRWGYNRKPATSVTWPSIRITLVGMGLPETSNVSLVNIFT